jgi:hypothetical protein
MGVAEPPSKDLPGRVCLGDLVKDDILKHTRSLF